MKVEVAYALPSSQLLLRVEVPEPCTVSQAIELSGIVQQFPELAHQKLEAGIFSRLVSLDTLLKSGDRVEIYRPLTVDPMQKRRLRAKKTRNR